MPPVVAAIDVEDSVQLFAVVSFATVYYDMFTISHGHVIAGHVIDCPAPWERDVARALWHVHVRIT